MASIATVEKLNSQLVFNAFHASSISIPPWKRHPCRSVLKSHFGKCVVFRGYRNWTLVWKWALLQHGVLRKKCPYSELFWSAFHPFGLNTEKYGVHLRIQSECWKIRIRITPNMDTFHAWGSPKIDKITVKYHESDFKKIMSILEFVLWPLFCTILLTF